MNLYFFHQKTILDKMNFSSSLYQPSVKIPQGFNPLKNPKFNPMSWAKVAESTPDLKRKGETQPLSESSLPLQKGLKDQGLINTMESDIVQTMKKTRLAVDHLLEPFNESLIVESMKQVLMPTTPVLPFETTKDTPPQYQVLFGIAECFTPADPLLSKWSYSALSSKVIPLKDSDLNKHMNSLFVLNHFNLAGKIRSLLFETESFKPDPSLKGTTPIVFQIATHSSPSEIFFIDTNKKKKVSFSPQTLFSKLDALMRKFFDQCLKTLETDDKIWESWIEACIKVKKTVPERVLLRSAYAFPDRKLYQIERILIVDAKVNLHSLINENGAYYKTLTFPIPKLNEAYKKYNLEVERLIEESGYKTSRIQELEIEAMNLRKQLAESAKNPLPLSASQVSGVKTSDIVDPIHGFIETLNKNLGQPIEGCKVMLQSIIDKQLEQDKVLQDIMKSREIPNLDLDLFSQPTQDSMHSQPTTQMYPREAQATQQYPILDTNQTVLPRSTSTNNIPNLEFQPLGL
jgi:hypothetical protein